MGKFSLEEVESHLNKIKASVKETLQIIETELISARDAEDEEDKLPIYLTKWRAKTASSVYLKTKRKGHKYESLSEITDYGGMRILCLYEQNIYYAHRYIVEKLLSNSDLYFTLCEFKSFNWDDESKEKFEEVVSAAGYANAIKREENKDSGYRSIHYVVENRKYRDPISIEIQLRTLLQDAWGELEHSLCYKQGSIHPHIKQSFVLLSQDLGTNDQLIAHLNDIAKAEKVSQISRSKMSGPFQLFSYDSFLDSEKFKPGETLHQLRKEYDEYIRNNWRDKSKKWIEKAYQLFKKIKQEVGLDDAESDKKFRYWVLMEDAYLTFQQGDLNDALEKYKNVLGEEKRGGITTYVTYFRYGEVLFILGQITSALVAFDKAELLCERSIATPCDDKSRNCKELYRIKNKLAHIYWQLGTEYFRAALEEINAANDSFEKYTDLFSEEERKAEEASLWNNICWYSLENYLIAQHDKDLFDRASHNYKKLASILDKEYLTSNALDTCAWFCFQAYKKCRREGQNDEAKMWLTTAKTYCQRMLNDSLPTRATVAFLSYNMQKTHFEIIMGEESWYPSQSNIKLT